FAFLAEAAAGGADDAGAVDQGRDELGRGVAGRDAGPDVEAGARRLDLQAGGAETADEGVAAPLVDLAVARAHRVGHAERGDARLLPRLKRARIEVRLDLPERLDHLRAAHREGDAPAGHVEGLREGVELDSDVLRARRLEEAWRAVAVEGDLGVSVVLS